MNYCKAHNLNYTDEFCPECSERVVEEAGRLPKRVTDPQAHPRCHRCWNLAPVCRCDGWLYAKPEGPKLETPIG